MKINGNDGSNNISKLLQDTLLKTKGSTVSKNIANTDDAASVDVSGSTDLSQNITAQSMLLERQAKVKDLRQKFLDGTLKPASSDDIAKKFIEGVSDQLAIAKVAEGE